jgi:hypothetical protein
MDEEIDNIVTRTSPGAYALGPVDNAGTFYVHRIGRSDNNLNRRLRDYIGQYAYSISLV